MGKIADLKMGAIEEIEELLEIEKEAKKRCDNRILKQIQDRLSECRAALKIYALYEQVGKQRAADLLDNFRRNVDVDFAF